MLTTKWIPNPEHSSINVPSLYHLVLRHLIVHFPQGHSRFTFKDLGRCFLKDFSNICSICELRKWSILAATLSCNAVSSFSLHRRQPEIQLALRVRELRGALIQFLGSFWAEVLRACVPNSKQYEIRPLPLGGPCSRILSLTGKLVIYIWGFSLKEWTTFCSQKSHCNSETEASRTGARGCVDINMQQNIIWP